MTEVVKVKEPLPPTVSELLARKTMKAVRTLNDDVDDIHVALWENNEEYMRLLDAVYDEDAVEGSLAIDNAKAAEMIRDYAKRNGVTYVANKKLATLVKSLNVVLRRYRITRKQRAVMVHGETISNGE
jgi:hypothetical protein